ncbi:hypothetical protein FHW36_103369 [Chitinophaga polysaccharea]|uniref:Uncharacterized protein n=1 Tax=Chitinophaga polysaccharea TaxID=1293035 RepID=A0A561PTX0_9BACT|nr:MULTISPECIES: hypothetical protein [Chitinophaga]NLR58463.1 hypothetical protein [Chitinophaga polysaccharea]NLU90991.1 hypothetical protein [Chitinophaga sp. Ak27]TWF41565.1 hypothetical protein FHW36_103369 [Chitinophaga polysaccharea]
MKSLTINHAENSPELHGIDYSGTSRMEMLFRGIFIFLVFCALVSIFFLSIFY